MIHKLARWVPSHVSGRVIVAVYWILNIFNYISGARRRVHREHNCEYLEGILGDTYIDNQKAWSDIRFGSVNMAYAGCEIIAAYNILYERGLGSGPEYMAQLISDFEKDGAVLGGRIGTSPCAIRRQLKRRGISSRMLWNVSQISNDAKQYIVTFINNRQDLYDQIHTVAAFRREEGYVIYNAWKPVVADTLDKAINMAAKEPVVVCILEIDNEY